MKRPPPQLERIPYPNSAELQALPQDQYLQRISQWQIKNSQLFFKWLSDNLNYATAQQIERYEEHNLKQTQAARKLSEPKSHAEKGQARLSLDAQIFALRNQLSTTFDKKQNVEKRSASLSAQKNDAKPTWKRNIAVHAVKLANKPAPSPAHPSVAVAAKSKGR